MRTTVTLLLALLFLNLASGASDTKSTASGLWKKGVAAARKGEVDTALSCMKHAFAQGLPDDSLYYLWAETYVYKGVLDTALALNYSIPVDSTSALRDKVFRQRHMIYMSLGWEKEAEALLDSLGGTLIPWYRKVIPECYLYLTGGGYLENDVVDKNYPYPRISDSTTTISNGNGVAALRIGWRIPVAKSMGIQFGGRVRYAGSRFSLAASTAHLDDSADASFGGYLNYSVLHDMLSLNYTFSRKRDFLDARSFYHQFALRYAILGKKWIGTVEAGYNYENPVREHYYYIMSWWNRMVGKRHDISGMLLLSGMTADALSIGEQYAYINFGQGRLFSDSTLSSPLLLSFGLSQPVNYDTLFYERTIPQSFWGINPSFRYEYRFNRTVSFGAGCGYQGTLYRQNYTWIDFRYPTDDIPSVGVHHSTYDPDLEESYLILNSENGSYYWLESVTSMPQVTLDEQKILLQSMRRIDQTLTLNLFFNWSFGRIGELIFDISIRRNFSNLVEYAPVDIERWNGAAMLTWYFRYRPDKN